MVLILDLKPSKAAEYFHDHDLKVYRLQEHVQHLCSAIWRYRYKYKNNDHKYSKLLWKSILIKNENLKKEYKDETGLYLPRYGNKAESIWMLEHGKYFDFILRLTKAMCIEHEYRFGKEHKSARLIPIIDRHRNGMRLKKQGGRSVSANEIPVFFSKTRYKDCISPNLNGIESNRLWYYRHQKVRRNTNKDYILSKWTKRDKPEFMQDFFI